MKRVGNIYSEMLKIENIRKAILDASRYKRNKKHVQLVLTNIEYYSTQIQEMLLNKTYVPSEFTEEKIVDKSGGKERLICKTNFFPDQIIHWVLINAIKDILSRGMYKYSCGSVKDRGPLYASDVLKAKIKSDYKNTKYCLKIDIKKYYESVDHDCLKASFRKVIKDKDCLWLIDTIIDSHPGLPIGTYTSQWFSNFYLQDLDHFIKEKLGVKYMVRYMDDVVMLGGNKKLLHKARIAIEEFLRNKKLKLKENWQVFKVASRDGKYKGRAIDFAGYKLYKDCRTIRKRTFRRIRRCIFRISKHLTLKRARTFMSYYGYIKHSDSSTLTAKYFKLISVKKIRKCISEGGNSNENIPKSFKGSPGTSKSYA